MECPDQDIFNKIHNDVSNALLSLLVSGRYRKMPGIDNICWTMDLVGEYGWLIYLSDLEEPQETLIHEIGDHLSTQGYDTERVEVFTVQPEERHGV